MASAGTFGPIRCLADDSAVLSPTLPPDLSAAISHPLLLTRILPSGVFSNIGIVDGTRVAVNHPIG